MGKHKLSVDVVMSKRSLVVSFGVLGDGGDRDFIISLNYRRIVEK